LVSAGGSRPAAGAAWPRAEFVVPAKLREWAIAEVGAGRLLPWFAVAFGTGIILYFTAEHEPAPHPVLRYPAYSVTVSGFVTLREESQKSDRFVMRVEHIDGGRIVETPERVRVSVRRGMAPPAGAFVEVKAQLEPPLPPLRPGGYDFARDLYFQCVG